ncbi:ATP-dependent DNA helicase RecG [Desulfolucanica intricata]|uniref:ATP-dependent DNA helicase RecG n=1 Tax=Desulfolucanica intricata TaxID=1285191 RepID=UPI000835B021|nr:ATP-dependent DNA helicase RecG [Desulfolucanica intricata]
MSVTQSLNLPIQYLKTVGPQRAKLLQKLKIFTIRDLLYHFPRRYEDRRLIRQIYNCNQDEIVTVQGTVLGSQDLKPRRGLTITKVTLNDGISVFYAVWFNQAYIKQQLIPGQKLIVTGKVDRKYGSVQIKVTDYEIWNEGAAGHCEQVVPIYPLSEKVSQKFLRGLVKLCLENYSFEQEEFIPVNLLKKYKLPSFSQALHWIHLPKTINEAEQARRRFIFEELFLLQVFLAAKKHRVSKKNKSFKYMTKNSLVDKFLGRLAFNLTAAQERVWQEITRDMESPNPMYRLLQGDVGSGKTVVSTLALLKAAESGLQGALMVPTEILAEQHYLFLQQYLRPLGVKISVLTGKMRKSEKERIITAIENGEMQIIVGTHTLIQEHIKFKNLALAVIDEQHRFGVRQRATLQYKGKHPDILVMTATPIPRTLAMTLYGDLDISVIDKLPSGRKPIKTHVISSRKLSDVYAFVKKELKLGRQAYIVCPLVEESSYVESQAAIDLAQELSEQELAEFHVGLLHGRMKPEHKDNVMRNFRQGKIDVLVSTTVIEVGVDVPNATVMVILDADRFGLAQLHQLRGRVGRGTQQSYCILIANPKTDEARARLAAMNSSGDGFHLAERDLQIRGPGEFYGTRQSGLPDLKIADLLRDWKILEVARSEAILLLSSDPGFKKPENTPLVKEIKFRFFNSEQFAYIG